MANKRRKTRRINKPAPKEKTGMLPKLLLVLAVVALGIWVFSGIRTKDNPPHPQDMGPEAALANYGGQISKLARKYDLSAEYLMALIMLECSGRADVPPRYEPGIYKKLQDVRSGKRTLEGISQAEISDASDEALKNLASSWGPFQLMGYKCFHLNIQIRDLRGDNSLEHGVKWINQTYGDYIRSGRYEDAFHIHNTGHPVQKPGKYTTYDKKYVPNGIKYMAYFKGRL